MQNKSKNLIDTTVQKNLSAMPRFEPGTLGLWDLHADHYTIKVLIWNGDKEKKDPIEKLPLLGWAFWTAASPKNFEMALVLFSRGNSPPLKIPLEAVFHALSAGKGGMGELSWE